MGLGGQRDGSGRKPKNSSEKFVTKSFSCHPKELKKIESNSKKSGEESLSRFIVKRCIGDS
jgi:hypothetical protein